MFHSDGGDPDATEVTDWEQALLRVGVTECGAGRAVDESHCRAHAGR